jgi:hypothetical protein
MCIRIKSYRFGGVFQHICLTFYATFRFIEFFVIVHPHPTPPPSRGKELIRSADKYSPLPWREGLGGGGAELLQFFITQATMQTQETV